MLSFCFIDNLIFTFIIVFSVPQSSKRVLRIDPKTEKCSFVGPDFEGRCKWYGGVIGNTDGAIYASKFLNKHATVLFYIQSYTNPSSSSQSPRMQKEYCESMQAVSITMAMSIMKTMDCHHPPPKHVCSSPPTGRIH